MRLIDADSLLKSISTMSDLKMNGVTIAVAVAKCATIDAVPVVRCKYCKYFGLNDENVPYCLNPFGLDDPEPNGFCSYGRKKNV